MLSLFKRPGILEKWEGLAVLKWMRTTSREYQQWIISIKYFNQDWSQVAQVYACNVNGKKEEEEKKEKMIMKHGALIRIYFHK